MTSQLKKHSTYARIPEFYDGKSILITGAGGFLGVVLLEILLRCCPGIQSIYILLREKKGVKPESRKESIFKRELFEKILEEKPNVVEKVHVVPGDISYPDLGLSPEDFLKITQEVSVVFHCAACVSFLRSLRFLIVNNAGGTYNIIELCRKCKKLEVLVYSSTVYSNCNRRTHIKEEIYRLPFPSQKFLQEAKNGTDESLAELVSMCMPNWPNDYAFSKCLAENVVLDTALDIPVVIIRPALITSIWKGSLPGYTEKNSALAQLSLGVGKGFIKVLLGDPKNFMDTVPADLVANAHIISAWRLVTERSSSPLVVNCSSYGAISCSFQDFCNLFIEVPRTNPVPNAFRIVSSLQIQKDVMWFRMCALYEHYLPALVMDTLLRLRGQKPILVPLYKFFDKAMAATYPFMTKNWTYDTENFKTLRNDLDKEDNEMFYTDLENLDYKSSSQDLARGCPEFRWKIDKRTVSERLKLAKRRHFMSEVIKKVFLILVFCLMYHILSKYFLYIT